MSDAGTKLRIKLTTTTEMYKRMSADMDINCADIIPGASASNKGARDI